MTLFIFFSIECKNDFFTVITNSPFIAISISHSTLFTSNSTFIKFINFISTSFPLQAANFYIRATVSRVSAKRETYLSRPDQ